MFHREKNVCCYYILEGIVKMSEIINLEDNGMFENILSMIYSA